MSRSRARTMGAGFGSLESLHALRKRLAGMHLELAMNVAAAAAPKLASLATAAFDAGQTVYGDARPLGTGGQALDLVASGKLRASLAVACDGTMLRATGQTTGRGAQIAMGKYKILPVGRLPRAWSDVITETVYDEAAAFGGSTAEQWGRVTGKAARR